MKKPVFLLVMLFLSFAFSTFAAPVIDSSYNETAIVLHTYTGDINGTLTMPHNANKIIPVALIIAGSGPTDRDGNNTMMKNNSLKLIAYAMAGAGIASVRYDKRGIAASTMAGRKEADLRFENYIDDAIGWIELLRKDKRFSKITVIGHSEGSLIGMIAAREADCFISIAGAGQSADIILKNQLKDQPTSIKDPSYNILDSLKAGKIVKNTDASLAMLFRESVQPYLISWVKYDPQTEIKKLHIPVLIIQGTKDLQVKEDDANRLAKAYPTAKLLMIENMNHVLKIVNGGQDENMKAYSNPAIPVSTVLTNAIVNFSNTK